MSKIVHIFTQYYKYPQPKEGELVTTECGEAVSFAIAEGVPDGECCAHCEKGLNETLAMSSLDEQSVYRVMEVKE